MVKKEYSDEEKAMVSRLSGYGLTVDAISDCVNISHRTLTRRFQPELRRGRSVANPRVVGALYAMATSGTNVAASIFWCKTRLGWSEQNRLEATGPDGKSLLAPLANTMMVPVISGEAWRETIARNQRALADRSIDA